MMSRACCLLLPGQPKRQLTHPCVCVCARAQVCMYTLLKNVWAHKFTDARMCAGNTSAYNTHNCIHTLSQKMPTHTPSKRKHICVQHTHTQSHTYKQNAHLYTFQMRSSRWAAVDWSRCERQSWKKECDRGLAKMSARRDRPTALWPRLPTCGVCWCVCAYVCVCVCAYVCVCVCVCECV